MEFNFLRSILLFNINSVIIDTVLNLWSLKYHYKSTINFSICNGVRQFFKFLFCVFVGYKKIDVISILTESENPRRYWSDLKIKLEKEGSQLYENIVQLKLLAQDGKMRMTDVASTEQLFRLIQSIPSPQKAL